MLDPASNLEEPTFLAIELIRLGILGRKDWFSHISGGPMRGTGRVSMVPDCMDTKLKILSRRGKDL